MRPFLTEKFVHLGYAGKLEPSRKLFVNPTTEFWLQRCISIRQKKILNLYNDIQSIQFSGTIFCEDRWLSGRIRSMFSILYSVQPHRSSWFCDCINSFNWVINKFYQCFQTITQFTLDACASYAHPLAEDSPCKHTVKQNAARPPRSRKRACLTYVSVRTASGISFVI